VRNQVIGVKSIRLYGLQGCNKSCRIYIEQWAITAKAEPACILKQKRLLAKVLGKEHPSYATIVTILPDYMYAMGNYAKAEPLYIEAKEIREKVLGKEHPDYAQSCNNLAGLYYAMGHYAKAEPLLYWKQMKMNGLCCWANESGQMMMERKRKEEMLMLEWKMMKLMNCWMIYALHV